MKKRFTFLIAILFSTTLLMGQTAHELEPVEENFQIFWQIDSPEDLIWLTDTLSLDADNDGTNDFDSLAVKWDANYRLTANIDFDPDSSLVDWNNDGTIDVEGSPDSIGLPAIGDYSGELGDAQNFTGTFDGQYYTISNIYKWDQNRGALFGNLGGAQIENLRLLNMRVYTRENYCGGIAGRATDEPAELDNNLIKRCWVEGKFIWIENTTDNMYSGGIIGRFNYGEIIECYSNVIGLAADITDHRRFGGILGQMQKTPTIRNCYSIAEITAEEQLGGLIARAATDEGAIVENCYAVAELTGKEPPDQRGAFAGDIGSLISTSCYWDKTIDTLGVGGGDSLAIVAVKGLETAEFANESNFEGWDFTNTWEIADVEGVQRPRLQWQAMIMPPTGTRDIRTTESLKVYPNPVSGTLIIEDAPLNAKFGLYNVVGKLLEHGIVTSKTLKLNMTNYQKGLYLLKVGDKVSKIMVR